MTRPTIDEIRTWPATVDVAVASAAIGISRSYGYELAKRGDFPVKTLPAGAKTRVLTADLMRVLGIDPNAPAPTPDTSERQARQPAAAMNASKDNDDVLQYAAPSALRVVPPSA